jgi:hypothetical protein
VDDIEPDEVLDFNDLLDPWERPGAVRRDCKPHRGLLLLALGVASLAWGLLSLILVAPGLLGLAFGIASWALATRDLAEIAQGIMDPDGIQQAQRARSLGVSGVVLSLIGTVGYAFLLLLCFAPRR